MNDTRKVTVIARRSGSHRPSSCDDNRVGRFGKNAPERDGCERRVGVVVHREDAVPLLFFVFKVALDTVARKRAERGVSSRETHREDDRDDSEWNEKSDGTHASGPPVSQMPTREPRPARNVNRSLRWSVNITRSSSGSTWS